MKILIADQRPQVCKAVIDQFGKQHEIKVTADGERALTLCRKIVPDVLLLDMELPRLDGLSILRAIRSAGLHTLVIVSSSCIDSDYVMRQLVQLGVKYFLPKPCVNSAVVNRVYEMICMAENRTWNIEDEVNSLLLSLGMKMTLSGYPCIRDALIMLMQDNSRQLTKYIYPEIALKYGGSADRIERVMRTAISSAWKRRDENMWRMYFEADRNDVLKCPTNGHFLARLSLCVDRRKIG